MIMVKLMKVPESMLRDLGSDTQEIMNKFFINTKEYIQSKLDRSEDNYFEVKCADLAYSSNEVNSNNRITYVEFKEKYVIAGMIETRTAYNFSQFTYFRDLSCLKDLYYSFGDNLFKKI